MEKENTPYMDDTRYLSAKSLIEALSAYSNPDTLKAYDDSYEMDGGSKVKFAPLVMAVGETLSNLSALDETQSRLLAELKNQVTELIKTHALIPVGFLAPRHSTSKPEIISLDVFLSGEINWDKSEIAYKDLEFTAIRLVEDETQKIRANNFQRSGGLAIKVKKSDKSHFSGLGPSQHLTEKEAANYLGISNRVIQGLRVKGGGPEFLKTGHAIRYRIADLDLWKNKE